jgi:hypothetical protein
MRSRLRLVIREPQRHRHTGADTCLILFRSPVIACPKDERDELALRILHDGVNGAHHRAGPRQRTNLAVTAGLSPVFDQQRANDDHQIDDQPARFVHIVGGPLVALDSQVLRLVQVAAEIVAQQAESVGQW